MIDACLSRKLTSRELGGLKGDILETGDRGRDMTDWLGIWIDK